ELKPFQAGIDAGADAVMMGHLIVKDVSEEPALFSADIVTGLLRREMGFKGVVLTDALQMKALTDHYGEEDIAVKSISAGVDMLLCPATPDKTINAIIKAVENGNLTEERINESVLRILTMKINRGIIAAD
ncbi:MAG: glycoside hydrolase family 3, partial [Oscillospiraceae bacterium]|nr:glycoside hydrolase family 3 [Oscillospiraceae bacterium]